MQEIYKDIDLRKYGGIDYTGLYKISNYGNAISLERKENTRNKWGDMIRTRNEQQLTAHKNGGYLTFQLWNDSKCKNVLVHRLVAIMFIPNPKFKNCVNHKDGNKKNNHIDNLEWVTYSENEKHSYLVLKKKNYYLGKTKENDLNIDKKTKKIMITKKIKRIKKCKNVYIDKTIYKLSCKELSVKYKISQRSIYQALKDYKYYMTNTELLEKKLGMKE